MKKRTKFLALFLAAALSFSLSACGSSNENNSSDKNPSSSTEQGDKDSSDASNDVDVLAAAQEHMKDVSSLNGQMILEMDMDISADGESQSMKTVTTTDMTCFYNPTRLKMDMTIDTGETGTTSTSIYAETDDSGTCTMYLTDGTTWQSQTVDMSALAQYDASSNMSEYVQDAYHYTEAGMEEVNGANAYKFSGTISGNEMKEALLSSGALNSLTSSGLDASQLETMIDNLGDIPIVLWIDEATLYPVKYEMDMTSVMDTLMSKTLESMGEDAQGLTMNISKMKLCMTCSDYNSAAEFSIPEEAKEATPAA